MTIQNKANWFTKNVAAILAIATVALSFALFILLVFAPVNMDKKDIIIYILGVLSAIDTQIFSYYFGSSDASDIKNKLQHHDNIDIQNNTESVSEPETKN
jgi:hypothetical protein